MDRLRLPLICGPHYNFVRIKGQPVPLLKTQPPSRTAFAMHDYDRRKNGTGATG
jgi:hypothetical protein